MLKYIGKNIITKALIIIAVVTALYLLLSGLEDPVLTTTPIHYYDTNEYIPMGDRIAVYDFVQYEKGLGLKYLSMFEHNGKKFYTMPGDDFPVHIITRKNIFTQRLYEFSHFIVKSESTLNKDIAESANYLSGYAPSLYDFSSYKFSDILKLWGVESADDIKSIEHHLLNYNNHIITDRQEIADFYEIISDVECSEYKGESKAGIDITINLKDGRQISRLRYSRTTDTAYMGDGGIRLEGYISGDKNTRFESIFYK